MAAWDLTSEILGLALSAGECQLQVLALDPNECKRLGGKMPVVIGRLHHLVLDTADPRATAEFWSAVLGQRITYDSDDFVVVAVDDTTSGLAFQLAPDHVAPTWPDPRVPQQLHLDVMVDDLDAARPRVLELGATPLGGDVFADPAGHPFCLIPRPRWAPPVQP